MKKFKGFTLIELLVVIAIIGMLSTLAVVALGNARLKARDAKRQSELRSLQSAIEMYIVDNNNAPEVGDTLTVDNVGNDGWDGGTSDLESALSTYLTGGLPEDPSSNGWVYCADTSGDQYLVGVMLEGNVTVDGDLDGANETAHGWDMTECVYSGDGLAPSADIDCEDSDGGSLDGTAGTMMCLGSNDS
jgi:prepilin-type N-terminal cleavage/methylation domain-containing protein